MPSQSILDALRAILFTEVLRLMAQNSNPLVILTVMLKDTLEAGRALTDAALERLLPATQPSVSIHQRCATAFSLEANACARFFAWKPGAWSPVPFPWN